MHIEQSERRDHNVLATWAVAMADVVRSATERSTGLAGGAPAALVAIVADPGLSIEDLRRVLGLTHPGTVRLVDRLIEQGWARREPGIGRSVRLEATVEGREAERRLAADREESVARFLAVLPERDVQVLAELVGPLLATTALEGVEQMRRLCRLCDRSVCEPCPAEVPQEPGASEGEREPGS